MPSGLFIHEDTNDYRQTPALLSLLLIGVYIVKNYLCIYLNPPW